MNILLYATSLILCFGSLATSMSHLETLHALRFAAQQENIEFLKDYHTSTNYNASNIVSLLNAAIEDGSFIQVKSFLSALPKLSCPSVLKEALIKQNLQCISLFLAHDQQNINMTALIGFDGTLLTLYKPSKISRMLRSKTVVDYAYSIGITEIINLFIAVGSKTPSHIMEYDIEVPFSQHYLLQKKADFLSVFIARLINTHNQYYKHVIQNIISHPSFHAIMHQVFLYTAPYDYANKQDVAYIWRYCANKVAVLHEFKDMSLIPKYTHSINACAQKVLSSAKWPTDILFIF